MTHYVTSGLVAVYQIPQRGLMTNEDLLIMVLDLEFPEEAPAHLCWWELGSYWIDMHDEESPLGFEPRT